MKKIQRWAVVVLPAPFGPNKTTRSNSERTIAAAMKDKTRVEAAEDEVVRAQAEFERNPNDRTQTKLNGARPFLKSVREKAAKDPDFNIRPES